MDEFASLREPTTSRVRGQSHKGQAQQQAPAHQSSDQRMTEPLSSVDTTWLRMNEPTNLMVISGLMMFDDRLDPERVAHLVGERLLAWPRFRQRVVQPSTGAPVWQQDPDFDVRSHVLRVALPPPRNRAALQKLVSDLMSKPLDETRPLWQAHIIEGLPEGTAIFFRLHHAIADGFALLKVMLALTDDPPGASAEPAPQVSFSCAASTDPRVGGVLDALRDGTRWRALAKLGLGGTAALARLTFMPFDPDTPLKGDLGVQKVAAWCDPIPLDRIKAAGRAAGATVNDVLLAAIAGGMRGYLIESGREVEGLQVRAIVPVNLRDDSKPDTLGNGFGLTFVPLPLGIENPAERLRAVHESTTQIKRSPQAIAAFAVLAAMSAITPRISEQLVRMFGAKATAVITNVPGPRTKRYLAGKPIKRILFWVPQSGHLGIGVSIFSYAGEVVLGVATDARLIPDPDRLVHACACEIESLSR